MTDSSENTRNYYRNQGAEAEKQRIIKLLEERLGWVPYGAIGTINDGQMMSITVEHLIALIKGEK